MAPLILPFDQAALYNIIAELLAGQALGWLGRRRSRNDYLRNVVHDVVSAASLRGIAVEADSLAEVIALDDFWLSLARGDAESAELIVSGLFVGSSDENPPLAAAALVGEIVSVSIARLPAEQRLQLVEVERIRVMLDAATLRLDAIQNDVIVGFAQLSALIRQGPTEESRAGVAAPRSPATVQSRRVAELSLSRLLESQYPWGEWSDKRTALESIIAERNPRASTSIPKPNVARTLFALEALSFFPDQPLDQVRLRALEWLKANVLDGWFWEWVEGQTAHSETFIRDLNKRPDVRHTAQALIAFSRWQDRRDPVASLIKNVTGSILPESGFWPNNPRGRTPRVLASVYAIEALATVEANTFRLPLRDIVDRSDEALARRALREGVGALLRDCEQGNGLLGSIAASPNAYLTGLAVFRLGSLASQRSDLRELVELMLDGLLRSAREFGWEDSSAAIAVRSDTRTRSTLRCAAGIARASSAGLPVDEALTRFAADLVEVYVSSENPEPLDSPDYACALICLFLTRQGLDPSVVFLGATDSKAASRREALRADWRRNIEDLLGYIEPLVALGVPGYAEAARECEERLHFLTVQR